MVFFKHNKNLTSHYPRVHCLLKIFNRLPQLAGAIVAIALICSPKTLVFAESGANDDPPDVSTSANEHNQQVFDEATRERLGIKTSIAEAAHFQNEIVAYGQVVNIQPLLSLHNQLMATHVEATIAAAKFKLAEQAMQRQQELFRHEIASKRSLESQQSTWQTDKNQWLSAQLQHQAAYRQARLNWGDVLTGWLNQDKSAAVEQLLTGQLKLLQINLPPNQHLAGSIRQIQTDPAGIREHSSSAVFISAAPLAATGSQGESYFFQSRDERLLPGMRVTAWISSGTGETGVMIPAAALVWHLDQAWIYVESSRGRFEHRIISQFTPAPQGYFVAGNAIVPGESVVVEGAQALLSAENRAPQQDDDD